MSKLAEVLAGLPTTAIVAIVVVLAVQLALQIVAVIDLVRRDRVLFDRKWIWALVIVAGNLLGAVVYRGTRRRRGRPRSSLVLQWRCDSLVA